ncbi:MAG: co-chaperone GroES [Candidatus Magasanikbacteria bacterium RIFOXYD2_FULL_39_9]|uniref:Co-chaperonin GroES n=1 Tax=Candidatus Magasanikbacteria bacterium RIFOXYD1_FULL_40_23 TaxID=1798705 RepID=A0A1F6P9F6_9BACT|nr:MAG: co-chaperone GroES [Candidatus Magasanikbacteria bacterium RIFOXYD1_FULL_40_23]OGH93508.1 MAG: co-chaperone GroES [Candidatus Magasanikbacteria bacterium RIFOXYD2_FULL_39_9]
MQLKPLGDNVLVKQIKADEVTSFGLVLPDKDEKKAEAEVVAIGPGKLLENGQRSVMEVKVGDKVLLKNWGGEKVELDKQEYKIVSQDDILAIFG